jgi:hypothetical protein
MRGGTGWLRHRATSREVAGSISFNVFGEFWVDVNRPASLLSTESTQILTEIGSICGSEGGVTFFYPGIKRLEREADYSTTASAEINKEWSFTFAPPYVFTTVTRMYVGESNENLKY